MSLSWNEIKQRAVAFSKEWESETSEDAAAQIFLEKFFDVFGVNVKRVATFEKRVKRAGGKDGYIDLLWKGTILIEMKSAGKDLAKAHKQAIEYFPGITDIELPQYILVCDFQRFRLYDLEANADFPIEFKLKDLVSNVQHFGFMAGYIKREFKEEDPVNIRAAEQMGQLHDMLKEVGYQGHQLEIYLVRILFCLFCDDTSIFDKGIFQEFVASTSADGRGLGARLSELFETLNTSITDRQSNLDEDLAQFPYVNGKLFDEQLRIPQFGSKMRELLLKVSALNWGSISPNIFGSMFQYVMNPEERRALGAHYTSEKNILKVIKPLFLDELTSEFKQIKNNRQKLEVFHDKLSKLTFLDPACGCGNFLIIAYRELRLLEMEVVKQLLGNQLVNVNEYLKVDVDQFYGIEIEEFPAQIAQVAMWLTDHQMNMRASEEFGEYYVRLPLNKSANVVNANSLRSDWLSLFPPVDYIFGNPPFIGKQYQTASQKRDLDIIYSGVRSAGVMDYVSAWFIKAAEYMQGRTVKTAFVATNSIAQGEQVGILWNELLHHYKCSMFFAHRTFRWSNESRGKAAVHVVIIGFATTTNGKKKQIFEYQNISGEPHELLVTNINPYLVDAPDIVISKRTNPLCNVPQMNYGSMPNDGGFLTLDDEEKKILLQACPSASKYIHRFVMGEELINNMSRWCLWLEGIKPEILRSMPEVLRRVESVRHHRESSKREATQRLAAYSTLFGEMRQPDSGYLALPRVSSVNRQFIPMAFLDESIIAGDKVYTIEHATLYHFGILTSTMHNAWMRYTGGRLKSDYSYSNSIVYNNFPWPENSSKTQLSAVEGAANKILHVRSQYPNASLADLYDPSTMPPDLVKSHHELDKAVDRLYSSKPFTSESMRIAFLFELYEKYTRGLFSEVKKKKSITRLSAK